MNYKEIAQLTEDQLKEILLTADGKGKALKEKVLEELLDRKYSAGYDGGYEKGWDDGEGFGSERS